MSSSAFDGPRHLSRKSQQMHNYSSEILKGYQQKRLNSKDNQFRRMVLDDEIAESLDDEIMKIQQ